MSKLEKVLQNAELFVLCVEGHSQSRCRDNLDACNRQTDPIKLLYVRSCSACIWIQYLTILWYFINISGLDFALVSTGKK